MSFLEAVLKPNTEHDLLGCLGELRMVRSHTPQRSRFGADAYLESLGDELRKKSKIKTYPVESFVQIFQQCLCVAARKIEVLSRCSVNMARLACAGHLIATGDKTMEI